MQTKFVLVHIPKTAGSTLRANLAWSLGLAHNHTTDIIGIDTPKPGMGYFDGLAAAAKARLPDLMAEDMQVMSGHYRYRDIAPCIADVRAQVSLVTFLRDPVRRTVSDYVYSTSDRHSGQAAFLAAYPTFEHYLDTPGQMNKQLDYLRPADDADAKETISSASEAFDFIGITEDFDADFDRLMTAAGLAYERQPSQNIGKSHDKARDLIATYHDKLQAVLAPDLELYRAFCKTPG